MQPGNREPLFTQNRIIAMVGIGVVIALIFLTTVLVVSLLSRPKTTTRVGNASIQATVTAMVLPTATIETKTQSADQPASPFQTPTRPATYSLQKGEWPICIARRYNLDLGPFFAANGLDMNSKPAPGTQLTVPTKGEWNASYGSRSLAPHPVKYTVKEADTLYSIACHYGDVSPEAILNANALSSASEIKPGQTLQIP